MDKIRPNHLQPRKNFDEASIQDLAQSIKHNGLAQPILVSRDPSGETYELIAGERRFRAAQVAGLREIEAVVQNEIDNQKRLALSLIENIQREDLNPIDEALAYLRLMKEFHLSLGQLADYTGKSKPSLSNTMRLLDLEPEIQSEVQNGHLTEGHARALLMIGDQFDRKKLFQLCLQQNLSVRAVEDAARKVQDLSGNVLRSAKSKRSKSPDILDTEAALQRILGTKVEIRFARGAQNGTLSIHFFSINDLDRVVSFLLKKL